VVAGRVTAVRAAATAGSVTATDAKEPWCRVSTTGQTTENQVREIEAAGFKVDARRIVTQTISGSFSIDQRPGFAKLLDRMERDDVLVVRKLDRLAVDVTQTVERLAGMGVRVHCLALGGVDLTSAAGKMTMRALGAVAQSERGSADRADEQRLGRAKAGGAALGQPASLTVCAARGRCGRPSKAAVPACPRWPASRHPPADHHAGARCLGGGGVDCPAVWPRGFNTPRALR
jgi:putative DNA-invertase from lambdoid prophage Rac